MKRFTRGMMGVLPPRYVLIAASSVYLALLLIPFVIFRSYGLTNVTDNLELDRAFLAMMCLYALGYAFFRLVAFHPLFNRGYGEWLAQSPWSYGKRLPNGPLQIVTQDLCVVGLLSFVASLHVSDQWILVPAIFFTMHAIVSGISFISTLQFRQAYLIALLLSGWLYVGREPASVFALMFVLFLTTRWGIRQSLQTFHVWNSEEIRNNPLVQWNSGKAQELQRERLLGWPYDRTGPIQSDHPLSLVWSVALSALAGWWLFSLMLVIPNGQEMLYFYSYMGLGLGSFATTIHRASGYSSPINLYGRLMTGRWIIPSYDKIFLAPLAVLTILFFSNPISNVFPESIAINLGITTWISIFVMRCLAPDLQTWRLTGNHRIVPGVMLKKAELVQTQ